MKMKLEIGKTYKAENGTSVKITSCIKTLGYEGYCSGGRFKIVWYDENGVCPFNDMNLIDESIEVLPKLLSYEEPTELINKTL